MAKKLTDSEIKDLHTGRSEVLPITETSDMDEDKFPASLPGTDLSSIDTFPKREKLPSILRYKSLTEEFNKYYSESLFPDDFLIINDIVLTNIPISSISFESESGIFVAETLRTAAPVVASNKARTQVVSLSLIFDTSLEALNKLKRLIAEISIHPLIFIYNNKIKKELSIPNEVTSIFILENGTLRNSPQVVGGYILDLTLHFFNYRPFSNHFWYNATMPGLKPDTEFSDATAYREGSWPGFVDNETSDSSTVPVNDFWPVSIPTETERKAYAAQEKALVLNSLGDLTGYEASSFKLLRETEILINKMKAGAYLFDRDNLGQNQPVPFPAASEAWLYFANHLESKITNLSTENSDFIGFELLEYETHIPPEKSQRYGMGSVESLMSESGFPDTASYYKAKDTADIIRKTTANTASVNKANATAAAVSEDVEGKVTLLCANGSFALDLNSPDYERLKSMTLRTKDRKAIEKNNKRVEDIEINTSIVLVFSDLKKLFPKNKIQIVKLLGGGDGPHARGEAVDVIVQNVSKDEVFGRMHYELGWGKNFGGAEYLAHPSQEFCHFSVSKTVWTNIDLSPPGVKAQDVGGIKQYNKMYVIKSKDASQWLINNFSYAGVDMTKRPEVSRDTSVFDTHTSDGYNVEQTIDPKRYESSENKDERSIEARLEWIKETERSLGLKYYFKDRSIKNVFCRSTIANISGDILSQQDDLALKGIVCVGISLNFGHKIVPQRLVSQDTCTFQFLGCGNKSGTMVFYFSGIEGRKSADFLKLIFARAWKNAKEYGSLIPTAGSILLHKEDPRNKNINNLLALLNIESIIVSDISEKSVQGTSDDHQLIVSFIAQSFAKENTKKKSFSSINMKTRLIRGLMKNLEGYSYTKDGATSYIIMPNPSLLKVVPKQLVEDYKPEARRYKESVPLWFAEALQEASKISNDINEYIPRTTITTNDFTTETWQDRYKEFDADNIIIGKDKELNSLKLALSLINNTSFQEYGQENMKEKREMQSRGYNEFLDRMSAVIDKIKRFISSDPANFDKYFPGIRSEMLESISTQAGECYSDMSLPKVPGNSMDLPPEFYIFNDSDEDPAIANMTDPRNMELFLSKHLQNQKASMKHFLKDVFLGGSYLSQNLPKILQERAKYIDQLENLRNESGVVGEADFFNPQSMLKEGAKTWDPLYYRTDPDLKETDFISKWKSETVTEKYSSQVSYYSGSNEEKARFGFMDNIIKMAPSIKYGRGDDWVKPYTDNNSEIVETIYGDNWRTIAFGPDPNSATVDEKNNGFITPEKTLSQRESLVLGEAKQKAKEDRKAQVLNIDNKTITVLPDGSAIVGDFEEKMSWKEFWEADGTMLEKLENSRTSEGGLQGTLMYGVQTIGIAGLLTNPLISIPLLAEQQIENIKDAYSYIKEKVVRGDTVNNIASSLPVNESTIADLDDNFDKKEVSLVRGIAFGTKGKDLSLRRIYPTFRIYFIEEDSSQTEKTGSTVLKAFDDFYSYSSIQEIKITRNRKIAADLAVIRMTNVGGKILRKKYAEGTNPFEQDPVGSVTGDSAYKYGIKAEYATGFLAETEKENPWDDVIIQDGVRTQIRLGYASDPDLLETVFLGEIIEVSPSEDGRIVEIVCQGYGAELESVELGPLDDGPVFYSSQSALSAAIIQESIVHFGRRSKFNKINPAEARHAFTGGLGKGLFASAIDTLFGSWGNNQLNKLFYRYNFLNYPQDDNIFAPPIATFGLWERFWNNACTYRPIHKTPWDVFKEHELRHPGYVSLALPYGHEPRMTMFFGARGQHYWSKPPSNKEILFSETISDNILASRGISSKAIKENPYFMDQVKELASVSPSIAEAVLLDIAHYGTPYASGRTTGELFGRYVPFRNYHYFDSSRHILRNEIKTSKQDVYNKVEVMYFENENNITDNDRDDTKENIDELANGEHGIMSCKLDENLPEEHIRTHSEAFPSCITSDMARRYVQGLFFRFLKDAYKGELIVLGEPTIKPYDVCYIRDTSINMYGPIEVQAVTHIFNKDHGFISIITPDLCTEINEYYSATTMDLVGAAFATLYSKRSTTAGSAILGASIASAGATIPLAGIGFLGMCGAIKIMRWTQDGVPVFFTPLTFEGRPYMSVAVTNRLSSIFTTWGGQWNQLWDDVKTGWRKFSFEEEINDLSVDWQEGIYSFLSPGRGAGYSTEGGL